MSEENVEIIRQTIEAWNREGIDAVIEIAHPDAVIYPFKEWPDDQVYRGREGWRNLLDQWVESFDEITWESDRIIDAEDQVIALIHLHAKIRGTGVPLSQPIGAVFDGFRDGTIAEAAFFLTWAEALEAAGLQE